MHQSLGFAGDWKARLVLLKGSGPKWRALRQFTFFISQLLHKTRLLVAITNTTSDYKKRRKIDFVLLLTRPFCIFLQVSVVNLNGTIEKFKIPVIVLLQWIIRDQALSYYNQLHLWCNLQLLFSRFTKNRDLLGRIKVSFTTMAFSSVLKECECKKSEWNWALLKKTPWITK